MQATADSQPPNKPIVAIVLSQYLGAQAHGAEAHTVLSFKRMLELAGYRVHFVGGEVLPPEMNGEHFVAYRYLHLPRPVRKLLHIPMVFLNLWHYCRAHRPNLLLNGGGVFYVGLAMVACGRIFGLRTLVRTAEDHFNTWRFFVSRTERWKHYVFNNLISSMVLKSADFVLTTGVASRAYFISKGIAAERIFGVPGPFLRERFFPPEDKAVAKAKLGFLPHDKVILYVGGISGVKGTDQLPEIVRKVLAQDPSARFLIVGRETEPGEPISKALRKWGGDRLSIKPPAPHNELLQYYQAADVLVFLTKVGVGYGQVNIEACLCGVPIVAYDPGGDVRWFLKDACTKDVNEIAERLIRGSYHPTVLPAEFAEDFIATESLKVFRIAMGDTPSRPVLNEGFSHA